MLRTVALCLCLLIPISAHAFRLNIRGGGAGGGVPPSDSIRPTEINDGPRVPTVGQYLQVGPTIGEFQYADSAALPAGLVDNAVYVGNGVGTGEYVIIPNCPTGAIRYNSATKVMTCGTAGAGHTIEDEGVPLATRTGLNFTGAGITCTDDAANDETDCDVPAAPNSLTDLADVTITTPATGATLVYDGADWIDGQLDLADADAVTGVLPDANVSDDLTLGTGSEISDTRFIIQSSQSGTVGDITTAGSLRWNPAASRIEVGNGTGVTVFLPAVNLWALAGNSIRPSIGTRNVVVGVNGVPNALFTIDPGGPTDIGLVIRSEPGHTANLLEIHDSTDTNLIEVTEAGMLRAQNGGRITATDAVASLLATGSGMSIDVANQLSLRRDCLNGQVLGWTDATGSWDCAAAGAGTGGHVIQDEGTGLAARANLNFTGAGITCTDDAGNDATDCDVPATVAALTHATDCSLAAGGVQDQFCLELDDNRIWFCESATCNAANWVQYTGTGNQVGVQRQSSNCITETGGVLGEVCQNLPTNQFFVCEAATCDAASWILYNATFNFSQITPATNTLGALLIGNGSSLDTTGTGTITANRANAGILTTGSGLEVDGSNQMSLRRDCTDADIMAWNATGTSWDCSPPATTPNVFGTITGDGGSDPIADSPNDTLTLQGGANMNILGNAGGDLMQFNVTGIRLSHPTDCTTATGGVQNQLCFELDDNTIYVCESATCEGAGWVLYGSSGGAFTSAPPLTTMDSVNDRLIIGNTDFGAKLNVESDGTNQPALVLEPSGTGDNITGRNPAGATVFRVDGNGNIVAGTAEFVGPIISPSFSFDHQSGNGVGTDMLMNMSCDAGDNCTTNFQQKSGTTALETHFSIATDGTGATTVRQGNTTGGNYVATDEAGTMAPVGTASINASTIHRKAANCSAETGAPSGTLCDQTSDNSMWVCRSISPATCDGANWQSFSITGPALNRITVIATPDANTTNDEDLTTFTVPETGDYDWEIHTTGFVVATATVWNKTFQIRDAAGGAGNLIGSVNIQYQPNLSTGVRLTMPPHHGTSMLTQGTTYTLRVVHTGGSQNTGDRVHLILRRVPRLAVTPGATGYMLASNHNNTGTTPLPITWNNHESVGGAVTNNGDGTYTLAAGSSYRLMAAVRINSTGNGVTYAIYNHGTGAQLGQGAVTMAPTNASGAGTSGPAITRTDVLVTPLTVRVSRTADIPLQSGSFGFFLIEQIPGGTPGHTIQDEGVNLAVQPRLNFLGTGVTCVDNAGNNATDCTIPGTTGGHTIQDEGVGLTARTNLNFTGAGITCTDNAGNDSTDCDVAPGGAAGNSFETIATPAGTSPVADSSTDTLNLVAGAGVTITGDETTDTVTIAATAAGPPTDFSNAADLDAAGNVVANGVALGADTTGNYIASIACGTGITGCAAASEGTTFTLSATATAPTFDEVGAGENTNTLTVGTGGSLSPNGGTITATDGDSATAFFTAGTIEAARLPGDLTGGTTIGGATVQTGPDDDVPESGDFGAAADLDATGAVAPDSVALTTDTTGNYIADIACGQDITGCVIAGEAAVPTLRFDGDLTAGTTLGGETIQTGTDPLPTQLAANGANCTAGNWAGGVDASGAAEDCTPDDDVPESGDFGAAADLEATGAISPNSVALTTDTTGNYVGEVTCGTDLIGCTAASEGAAHTIAFDGDLSAGTTLDGQAIQVGADDDIPEAGDFGNAADLDATGAVSADAVALSADTTGNYVASIACGAGVTGCAAASEGATFTLSATGVASNSFETHATPAGTSPVAESATDTLTYVAGQDITITGDAGTDTVTIALDGDLTAGTTLGGQAIQTGTDPAPSFDQLATGTNSTATMTVGTGSTLNTSGTGSIVATSGDSATGFFATGMIDEARIDQDIHRDNETKPGSLIDFTDVDGTFPTATTVESALTELNDALAGGPNNGGMLNWSQLVDVPADFADGALTFNEVGAGENTNALTVGTGGTLAPNGGTISASTVHLKSTNCFGETGAASGTICDQTTDNSLWVCRSTSPATCDGTFWETLGLVGVAASEVVAAAATGSGFAAGTPYALAQQESHGSRVIYNDTTDQFTLAAGSSYVCTGNVSLVNFNTASAVLTSTWYNVTAGDTAVGTTQSHHSSTHASNIGGGGLAIAHFNSLTANTIVEFAPLRVIGVTDATADTGGQFGLQASCREKAMPAKIERSPSEAIAATAGISGTEFTVGVPLPLDAQSSIGTRVTYNDAADQFTLASGGSYVCIGAIPFATFTDETGSLGITWHNVTNANARVGLPQIMWANTSTSHFGGGGAALAEFNNLAVDTVVALAPHRDTLVTGMGALGGQFGVYAKCTEKVATEGLGHTIQDEGVSLTGRQNLDFIGAGVTCTDDAGNNVTDCVIPGETLNLEASFAPATGTIQAGTQVIVRVPSNATIVRAYISCMQTGSIVVDVWRDAIANSPVTDADSITAAAPITVSAAAFVEDTTLAGWTTALTAGDVLVFNVDSAATVTNCTAGVTVTKS